MSSESNPFYAGTEIVDDFVSFSISVSIYNERKYYYVESQNVHDEIIYIM